MHFSHRIEVTAAVDEVWAFLWRAEEVGACLPGCENVRTVEALRQYEATVAEQVGPFRVRFDWLIDVQDQEPLRRIVILARGKDARMGATARAQMAVTLAERAAGGSQLEIETELQVTGKIASLGQTVMKRKADRVVNEFAESLRLRLDAVTGRPADA
jgi:carbon monoxide dehydrogenase subunit G